MAICCNVTEVKVIKEKMAFFSRENVDKKFAAALTNTMLGQKELKLFHASFAHFNPVKFAQKYRVWRYVRYHLMPDGKILNRNESSGRTKRYYR